MDSTMFQLRSFVHQRLFTAAEEILGEVEKTITLAFYEAKVSRSKEEGECSRHQLEPLRHKSAEEPSLTCSTAERGDKCDAALLQEDPGPFSLRAEGPGPAETSEDLENNTWNYCLVKVGEVCLEGSPPENCSSRNPTAFLLQQQPIESNKASRLFPPIPHPANHRELASLKMPRRMKRKRTTGPNLQDPPEQTAITTATNTTTNNNTATSTTTTSHTAVLTHSTPSTQHTPAPISLSSSSTQHNPRATPAPSTPKIFKEICSILPLSSGGKKKRCKITVEELARRVGPPEYMSFSSLAAYLRTDNNARRELQAQLEGAGIKPTEMTTEMSLFSRLCEEEVDALCESLAGLVRDHLPFQGLHVIPKAEDKAVTLGRLSEFQSYLRRAIAAIKERVEAVDLASHGFMSKMLDIILSIFEKCLDNQISSLY